MKDLLEAIESVIAKEYRCRNEAKTHFILTEDGKDASCQRVELKSSSTRFPAYKFDVPAKIDGLRIQDPFLFLSEGSARSKCDYILFYPHERGEKTKMCVLVCNLKSKNLGNNEDQIISGKIFAEFLIKTAIRVFNKEKASDKPESRYDFKRDVEIKAFLFADLKRPPRKGITNHAATPKRPEDFIYKDCSKTWDLDTLCSL